MFILEKKMIIRLLLVFSLIQSVSAEEYHFVAISGLYEQEVGEIVLAEIYRKLEVGFKVSRVPGQRAVIEATQGRVDGEVMRIWSYGEEHPEVIRIPTSYYFLETMAFYKKGSGIKVSSVEDLAKYSVLKVRGVKHTNSVTAGLVNVYDFDDTKSMLTTLDKRRKSVALTHRGDGLFALEKYGIDEVEFSEYPLFSFPLYHYVHKNHAHLVDKIDRVILDMKEAGDLDRLIRRAERQVFESNGLSYQEPD